MFGTPEIQKAYELSYATFRVAALVRKPDLKERLERQAGALLEKAAGGSMVRTASGFDKLPASGELESVETTLETLRALIMLSEGIGEIRYVNAKVLLRELGNLERMVKESVIIKERGEEFDVEKMFSTIATGKAGVEDTIRRIQERREAEAARHAPKVDSVVPTNAVTNPAKPETRQSGNGSTSSPQSGNGNGSAKLPLSSAERGSPQRGGTTSGNGNGNGNGEARSSSIYAKVQRGNISIKDLLAEFGTVSERTLRYDLQRLVEQGKVERVGSGGPGTYYRLPVSNPLLATPSQPLISETTIH